MKLSAPIYRLKRQARLLSRAQAIPLHQALNAIARNEGFDSWSLLAHSVSHIQPGKALIDALQPGDLMLLGARPGHGKTLLGLEMAVAAMKTGRRGAFFTLEFAETDIAKSFAAIGEAPEAFAERFYFDASDDIDADYVIARLGVSPPGTIVVIDYLQLLDQKRENPELSEQVKTLKTFAQARGAIIVFISQIDRRFDPAQRPLPDASDIRLPNPLDLTLFDKTCFLHDGQISIGPAG
ncbi:MAG: replicative DNA helicase [Gammaproteobacteria bacterium]|nr:replicative DNA helicase [Gammaproteobacteria bacterium]